MDRGCPEDPSGTRRGHACLVQRGMDLKQVRDHVRGKGESGSDVGSLTLEGLRRSLGGGESESLLELVKEKREREKVEELREVKIRHQQARARKHKEAMEIQKVMLELERRKRQELELRLQKERIQQGLERIDRSHLGKLEAEKKRELEKLTKERQSLQDKEEAVLRQVGELEQKIIEQEELNNKRKQEVENALVRRQGSKLEQKNAQLLQLAKAHGERTSTLLIERQKLENERQKLEETLAQLDRGGPMSPKPMEEENVRKVVDEVENNIAKQEENLARMKFEHEQESIDWMTAKIAEENETNKLRPPGINKSLPFAVEAESFLDEWLSNDPRRSRVFLAASEEIKNAIKPAEEETMNENMIEVEGNLVAQEPPKNAMPNSISLLEQEIESMKREYMELGCENSAVWKEIQALERRIGREPSKMPSAIKMDSPISPQLETHLQKQQRMLDIQTKALQRIENSQKKTAKKIKKTKKKKKSKLQWRSISSNEDTDGESDSSSSSNKSVSSDEYFRTSSSRRRPRRPKRRSKYYSGERKEFHRDEPMDLMKEEMEEQQRMFSKTMDSLSRKLQTLGQPQGFMQTANQTHQQQSSQGEGSFISDKDPKQVFMQELSTLEMIPKNSDLYDMQIEHLKLMTRRRLELDELKQEHAVSELRDELERKQQESLKKAEFEDLKVEQERQLELARLRRALAKENSELTWNGKSNGVDSGTRRPYDPQAGFVVYFDYVTEIPKRFHSVRLVFCIYDGETVKSSAKALPSCETEMESPTKSNAHMVARKKFQKVPGIPSLRLVMELQCVVEGDNGKSFQSIGWCYLNLFESPNVLHQGAFKIQLRKPPFKISDLNEKPEELRENAITLFLRVLHQEDMEAASEFVVDPSVTKDVYNTWPIVKTPNGEEERKKGKRGKPAKARKKKNKSSSDTASVANSLGSAATQSQSVASNTSGQQRLSIQVESVAFENESPARPIFVRIFVIQNQKQGMQLEASEARFLQAGAGAQNVKRILETEPRDIRLSTGRAMWQDQRSNPFLLENVGWEKSSILLFKLYEAECEGDDGPERNGEDEQEDSESGNMNEKLIGWAVKSLLGLDGEVELSGDEAFIAEFMHPPMKLPFNERDAEWLNGHIEFRIEKTAAKAKRRKRGSSAGVRSNLSADSKRIRKHGGGDVGSRITSIAEEDPEDMLDEDAEEDDAEDDLRSRLSERTFSSQQRHKHENVVATWAEVRHPPPDGKRVFERGEDGFDVYVDGARFLPDYVTLSSAHVKLMLPSFEMVGEEKSAFPRLSESAYNPKYRLRAEFRGESIANPVATLLFRVDTIDRYTQKTFAVGYACLNAFVMPNGSMEQPSKPMQQEFVLNEGAFQLPLFQLPPNPKKSFDAAHFVEHLAAPRVPCSTLLVRIFPAKKSKDGVHILKLDEFPEEQWMKRGLVIPEPLYKATSTKNIRLETYDSTRCVPYPCEKRLYNVLIDREDALIGEVAPLAKRPGIEEDDHVEIMEDEELTDWIKKRLQNPKGMMSLDHATQYQLDAGFKVRVSNLVNLRSSDTAKGKVLKVIFSLCPPGGYYGNPRLTENVGFTTGHDFEAGTNFPTFTDELFSFREVPYDPKLVLIVDVKVVRYTMKSQMDLAIEDVAWGVVPIFDKEGPFTRNGIHLAPLFSGQVDTSWLADLQASELQPLEFIRQETLKAPKQSKLKVRGNAGVLVHLVDDLLLDCFRLSDAKVRTDSVPEALESRYTAYVAERDKKPLHTNVPKQHRDDLVRFEKELNEFFAKRTDIASYAF